MAMEIQAVAAAGEEEDRVMATAHHIVKSLGSSEHMARDMLTILSMSNENLGNAPRKSADYDANLASMDRIISFWYYSSKAMLFQSSRKEVYEYLAAVDGLRQLIENLVDTPGSSSKLMRAQRLMEMSMARLRKEFHRILSASVEPTLAPDDCNLGQGSSDDEASTDQYPSNVRRRRNRNRNADEICEIDMMPLDAVLDLRSIAKRVIAGGYGGECVRIYELTRKSVIKGCLHRIGVEWVSTSDVQRMEWGALDIKIKNWICAVRVAVRILFASEKRLCDEIFAGLSDIRDSCFTEVAKGPTKKLLAFGESVAMSKKSSERLFRVLDMYETLSDLMPDIDTVYCPVSCASVRTQASTLFAQLGESVREILTEFENAIQAENSKTPVPGGTIHPLTRYVMNYLSFLSDYKEALMNITANAPIDIPNALPDDPADLPGDLVEHDDELGSPASALSVRVGWIIRKLQHNLELKSNLYKDLSLSYLFLTNNLHYIVQKIKVSELLGLLGHDWMTKNEDKVRQYTTYYERAAWMKVFNCLRDEDNPMNEGCSYEVSQQAVKDRLKGFNLAIEEVLWKHSGWMVPDVQLQDELRHSIIEKMIPEYRSFLGRFNSYLESGRHSEIYTKYTPEGVEARLLGLFKATHHPRGQGHPRRKEGVR